MNAHQQLAFIWVNHNNSPTWIVGPFGDDFPYENHDSTARENRVRSWWNLPRFMDKISPLCVLNHWIIPHGLTALWPAKSRLRLGLQASAAEALTLGLQLLLCSSAHQTNWIYLLHMEKDYGISKRFNWSCCLTPMFKRAILQTNEAWPVK